MIQTHCFLSGVTLADLAPVLRSEIELLFRKLIGTPEWVRHDLFVDAIFAPKVGHVSTVEPNLFPGGSYPIHHPLVHQRFMGWKLARLMWQMIRPRRCF